MLHHFLKMQMLVELNQNQQEETQVFAYHFYMFGTCLMLLLRKHSNVVADNNVLVIVKIANECGMVVMWDVLHDFNEKIVFT